LTFAARSTERKIEGWESVRGRQEKKGKGREKQWGGPEAHIGIRKCYTLTSKKKREGGKGRKGGQNDPYETATQTVSND